jgi:hypothetical protein
MPDKDASAHENSLPQEGSLPFFTRFLEGQDNNAERSAVTHKYPSDWDEMVTMKYPSDDDEGGEESAFGSVRQLDGGANQSSIQTLKYPSDRDEWDFN